MPPLKTHEICAPGYALEIVGGGVAWQNFTQGQYYTRQGGGGVGGRLNWKGRKGGGGVKEWSDIIQEF